MPHIRRILQEMGLHHSVQPPPFRDLVQHKKQSERLLAIHFVSPGSLQPLLRGLWIVFRLCAGASALCSPIPLGFLRISPRPVGGRLDLSVEAVAASAADLGFGPAGAAIFLGHFWVTYSAMTQSNTTRNVPYSHTIHIETQCLETKKYDTFRKNSLS